MHPHPSSPPRVPRAATLAAALCIALAAPFPALAGPAAEATDLATVVVTAAGFEQKITDAPASISVIDHEELARKPYASLVDALRGVEGIDVALEAPDKNGMGSISMRGMPSEYTLVLIDGRRQSNVGSLYPNNFGGGQFSYLPPLDAVERIEVVRGPMSTLYGSDAMGGVVNIITRKVSNDWRAAFTYGGTLQQESEFGNDRSADLYMSGPLIEDKLGVTVRGSYYDRDESIPDWDPLPLPSPPNDPGSVFERSLGFGGGASSDEAKKKLAKNRGKEALERLFSPEFRNRLDAIVTFNPLSFEVMETIVEKFILQLEAQLAERRVAFVLEPAARAWLAKKGYDPVFGARPLARVVQTEVRDPLTDEILFGRLERGGTVRIGLEHDKLAFSYEPAAETVDS